MISVLDNLKKS